MNPDYLSDAEKAQVISFTSNKPMFAAVRKVLLAAIYHQGTVAPDIEPTVMNWAFSLINGQPKSDEQLGQEVRASVAALGYLNSALERLQEFKTDEPKKKKAQDAL